MRTLNRLTARTVSGALKVGMHADGAGLYLRVRGPTVRSWVFVWHAAGKRREMGMGSPPYVSLAKARERAQKARDVIADGGDPLIEMRTSRDVPTFGQLADEFIRDRTPTVRSDKSVLRWQRTIGEGGYAEKLRPLPIDKVTTETVLDVLRPIWTEKASTAGLMRGYIEAVLSVAKVKGHRKGDNPAAWKGHLELILPKRGRLSRGHHKAMAYTDIPAFMKMLQARPGLAFRALELTVLCANRTSETLSASWDEIDLSQKIWTIPAGRMKGAKEHRIRLSEAAIQILTKIEDKNGYVFKGQKKDKPLSNMAMEMVMRRLEIDATVHGFRSSFRDWAGDMTDTPREVVEAALAHTVGNSAEQAYRRGDAIDKRRKLMEAWAGYCGPA